ncbi:MAG TPA: putative metal-dependent hydrolase [Gemmatimonadales bacterium]|nr:putative metal-dependent hydrolase [Gemmatimonadales bacterium]
MSDPRYPIGKLTIPGEITPVHREGWIGEIADAPGQLRTAVHGLGEAQFDTPYREGGWTVRQVVHHLPDSHLNAYVRFKLALTEDNPVVKPYQEARWAELPDTRDTTIGVSLVLLEALHRRWVVLLRAMAEADWGRTFFHPEQQKSLRLDRVLAMYAWHGRHHVGHITALRDRMGWH